MLHLSDRVGSQVALSNSQSEAENTLEHQEGADGLVGIAGSGARPVLSPDRSLGDEATHDGVSGGRCAIDGGLATQAVTAESFCLLPKRERLKRQILPTRYKATVTYLIISKCFTTQ